MEKEVKTTPKKKVYFVKKDRESCNRYNRNG